MYNINYYDIRTNTVGGQIELEIVRRGSNG
jgi:hypothetical protein